MQLKRDFHVSWQDLADPAFEPLQAVRVVILMPKEIADAERQTINGIENLINNYKKRKSSEVSDEH